MQVTLRVKFPEIGRKDDTSRKSDPFLENEASYLHILL